MRAKSLQNKKSNKYSKYCDTSKTAFDNVIQLPVGYQSWSSNNFKSKRKIFVGWISFISLLVIFGSILLC